MELLLHGIYPFISFQWLCRFFEYWRPRVHEFLEIAILVHFMFALVQPTVGIVGNVA